VPEPTIGEIGAAVGGYRDDIVTRSQAAN
jgi:hypothetical protein